MLDSKEIGEAMEKFDAYMGAHPEFQDPDEGNAMDGISVMKGYVRDLPNEAATLMYVLVCGFMNISPGGGGKPAIPFKRTG